MEGSGFVFDHADGLHYKSHTISLRRCGSYIDSPEWIKSKKATTNKQNNDKNCFKYVVIVALNHENIGKNPQKNQRLDRSYINMTRALINMTGMKYIFSQKQKTGKSVKQTTY